jgi:hypothetical protein
MRARCLITEHLADRRKSPVWSTEVTYLPGSRAGVPEERSAALIYARWSASLKMGMYKGAWAGLKTLYQRIGVTPHAGACAWSCGPGLCAENTRGLSPRPAAAGTEEEGQRSQPRCRSGSPATKPSGPGANKLDPPDHTQPSPSPPRAHGAPGGVKFPLLASL